MERSYFFNFEKMAYVQSQTAATGACSAASATTTPQSWTSRS